MRATNKRARSFSGPRCAALVLTLALVLVASLVATSFPFAAQAYYIFGTVKVSAGASNLSVNAGSSTSTSLSVSPSSDRQTLGCGMAQCPQVCNGEGALEAGYTCFDENGQCTCAGTSYSTYYADVSASSSNSGVATASVSGGTLVVKGRSAGTATITVNASLRQWNSGSTKVKVTVREASSSGSSGSTGATGSSGSSASGSTGSGGSSSISATPLPETATPTQSRDDALNEQVIETTQGLKVYSVEINSYLNTETQLKKIVGTQDQCVFWSGTSSASPDYSWTFDGEDVDGTSAALEFDPTITVSELGTGNVSNIMDRAKDGIVLEFAHEGELPGKAAIYVKTDGVYADGTALGLFIFDEEEKKFERVEGEIETVAGYASFTIDHCSTWALSTDDLTAYEVEEAYTPRAIAEDEAIGEESGGNVVPIVIVAAAAVLVIAAIAIGLAVRSRRKNASASEQDAQDDGRFGRADEASDSAPTTTDADAAAEDGADAEE